MITLAPTSFENVFHVGYLVPDLLDAMDALGRQLEITWATPFEMESGFATAAGEPDSDVVRIAFSSQGPPYLEIIEVVKRAGSVFAEPSAGGYHHFGIYAERWRDEVARLTDAGMELERTGAGVAFVRDQRTGVRVEVARTSFGALRGERCGPVVAFRGVPYAASPVGERRWRAPAPVGAWSGERDATRFGPVPPQDMSPERLAKRGVTMGEDCLSLNVWTPAADDAARPVVVFLHGGGVVLGAASAPLFDGARLAARGDIVVVTVGFRLGALGSLYAPDRLGPAGEPTTNLAYRDQLHALRWVREEIAGFGGDPGRVTVMGQSSGAVAIACMLAGDAGEGLFDRVILQSGGLERVRSTEAAADVARQFFDALGVRPGAPFDRLAPAVDEIVAAQGVIPTGFVPPVGPFHHAIDGDVIPEHPLVVAASRALQPVPILAGTTRDEWRAFDTVLADEEVTDAFVRDRARALAGDDADVDAIVELYRSELGAGDDVESRRAVASALVTDFHFAAPTEQLTRAHAAHGNQVFRYELQWESPRPGLGACHDMCLPLVFGTTERVPGLAGTGADVERMSGIVQDAWIAFIRAGDPGWPASSAERRTTMLLGPEPHVVHDHRAARLAVWEGRYPASG